jgi:hypothetical protein
MSKRLRSSEWAAATDHNTNVATTESSVRTGGHGSRNIMKKWWNDDRTANEEVLKEKKEAERLLESERLLVKQLRDENEKLKRMRDHDKMSSKSLREENAALLNA